MEIPTLQCYLFPILTGTRCTDSSSVQRINYKCDKSNSFGYKMSLSCVRAPYLVFVFLRGTYGVFHYYHKPPSVLRTVKHIFIVETCGKNFKPLIIDSVMTVNGQTRHVSSKSLWKVHLTAVQACCIFQFFVVVVIAFLIKSSVVLFIKPFWLEG